MVTEKELGVVPLAGVHLLVTNQFISLQKKNKTFPLFCMRKCDFDLKYNKIALCTNMKTF